tara:strand:+ start:77 stop:559 length:483 start_codon:yes stop_codon:yes gene_type:complete
MSIRSFNFTKKNPDFYLLKRPIRNNPYEATTEFFLFPLKWDLIEPFLIEFFGEKVHENKRFAIHFTNAKSNKQQHLLTEEIMISVLKNFSVTITPKEAAKVLSEENQTMRRISVNPKKEDVELFEEYAWLRKIKIALAAAQASRAGKNRNLTRLFGRFGI